MKYGFKFLSFRAVFRIMFAVMLAIQICAGLFFLSCSFTNEEKSLLEGPETDFDPAIAEGAVNAITTQQAYVIFSEKNTNYFFLDVRTTEEFSEGHIEGAVLIPLAELESRTDELPSDKAIIVYCKAGSRSLQASNILIEKGFKKILNMEGGVTEWKKNGYPLVMD